ncbi:MAG TPA: hypothetical protein VFE17_01545 [Candidatus Baltobacteraceae bacterium]|jgi:hypothetical protein|nr:hypothetical protein [Candidatus Baltobacteraceae bacterium]
MKRRYKPGDWLRIPLGAEFDALAIITHGVRSRLFGYFFPVACGTRPSHADLVRLGPQDAVMCALFGGAALEEARWALVAASLHLRAERWPFPDFCLRGAFGRTWQRVTYDTSTMAVQSSQTVNESGARELPDARFATPQEIEDRLRQRLGLAMHAPALSIYEIAAGFDPAALSIVLPAGRLQVRGELPQRERALLAGFINRNPGVELRVCAPSRFDVSMLSDLTMLTRLILDTPHLQHPQALRALTRLQHVRIWASCDRTALPFLPSLRSLELVGAPRAGDAVEQCAHLQSVTFAGGVPERFDRLAARQGIRELSIRHAHGVPDPDGLTALRSLELRDVRLAWLPHLHDNTMLERVVLEGVGPVRDLRELAKIKALRELSIRSMPQLAIADFLPLSHDAAPRRLDIDLGSRRKNKEVYRVLRSGMIHA